MSRSSRDERDQANEPWGWTLLSQDRSGEATSAEGNQDQSTSCHIQQPVAGSPSRSIRWPEREHSAAPRRSRDLVFVRNRAYRVSSSARQLITEVGKFRTIAVADLARYRYAKEPRRLRQDI